MSNKNLLLFLCMLPIVSQAQPEASPSPSRAALVDTGYDACIMTSAFRCENNKNLLFRGNQPLDDTENYLYDPDVLRQKVFSYLQEFKQAYDTDAVLPNSLAELNNYRIVVINLLYDYENHGTDDEYNELTYEFKHSGSINTLQVPEQHKMYNLTSPFNANQYAFEWWPITLKGETNPQGIPTNVNWPNKEVFQVPRSNQFYKPMDLPYLVTGIPYPGFHEESDSKDLLSLLLTQPNDGHPLLIFYHCVAGVDRTGAVTLSYFMKHGGYANISNHNTLSKLSRNKPLSFAQALKALTNANYPGAKEEAMLSAQAYCLTLGKADDACSR